MALAPQGGGFWRRAATARRMEALAPRGRWILAARRHRAIRLWGFSKGRVGEMAEPC